MDMHLIGEIVVWEKPYNKPHEDDIFLDAEGKPTTDINKAKIFTGCSQCMDAHDAKRAADVYFQFPGRFSHVTEIHRKPRFCID